MLEIRMRLSLYSTALRSWMLPCGRLVGRNKASADGVEDCPIVETQGLASSRALFPDSLAEIDPLIASFH